MARRPDAQEMDRSNWRYVKIVDSIPDYKKRNLKEMAGNKGYIWKGVHLYGLRPKEKPFRKTVLFEKLPRGLLNIHEWNDNMYRMYEKQGQQAKVLTVSERRKPIRWEPPKRATAIEDMTNTDFPTLGGAPQQRHSNHMTETRASQEHWAKIQTQHWEVESRDEGRRR